MKILTHDSAKIEFKELDAGTAFYDESGKLYMKVNKDRWPENAVCLATGILWTFSGNILVSIANVHIEDD